MSCSCVCLSINEGHRHAQHSILITLSSTQRDAGEWEKFQWDSEKNSLTPGAVCCVSLRCFMCQSTDASYFVAKLFIKCRARHAWYKKNINPRIMLEVYRVREQYRSYLSTFCQSITKEKIEKFSLSRGVRLEYYLEKVHLVLKIPPEVNWLTPHTWLWLQFYDSFSSPNLNPSGFGSLPGIRRCKNSSASSRSYQKTNFWSTKTEKSRRPVNLLKEWSGPRVHYSSVVLWVKRNNIGKIRQRGLWSIRFVWGEKMFFGMEIFIFVH